MSTLHPGQFLGQAVTGRTFRDFSLIESRYAAKQCLSRHSHERPYISILLRGSYTERCGSRAWDCSAGQVIFHGGGEVHSNQFFEDGGELLNLEILPSFAQRLSEDGIRTDLRTHIKDPGCFELALRLHWELRSPDSLSGLAIEGVVMELAAHVLRRCIPQQGQEGHWVERVKAILREQFTEPPSLNELAQTVHVHPVHLARTFRQRLRCTVGDYVRMLRVEAAYQKLRHTDLPIASIAADTGFADQSHLCRTLKRYTGMSPLCLRRQGLTARAK
jgi:AraC family transcriptional regulator